MFLCRFEKALIQYLSNLPIQICPARLDITIGLGSIKGRLFDFRVNKSVIVNKLCKSEVKTSYQKDTYSKCKLHFMLFFFFFFFFFFVCLFIFFCVCVFF